MNTLFLYLLSMLSCLIINIQCMDLGNTNPDIHITNEAELFQFAMQHQGTRLTNETIDRIKIDNDLMAKLIASLSTGHDTPASIQPQAVKSVKVLQKNPDRYREHKKHILTRAIEAKGDLTTQNLRKQKLESASVRSSSRQVSPLPSNVMPDKSFDVNTTTTTTTLPPTAGLNLNDRLSLNLEEILSNQYEDYIKSEEYVKIKQEMRLLMLEAAESSVVGAKNEARRNIYLGVGGTLVSTVISALATYFASQGSGCDCSNSTGT